MFEQFILINDMCMDIYLFYIVLRVSGVYLLKLYLLFMY